MTDPVVDATVARLTASFPDWHNATGAAHPTPAASLPAFAVRVTYSDAERVGMGDARMLCAGQIEVGLELATPADGEAGAHALAGQIVAAITAAPADLGGVVWDVVAGGFEADHDTGETPISRGDQIFAIQVLR